MLFWAKRASSSSAFRKREGFWTGITQAHSPLVDDSKSGSGKLEGTWFTQVTIHDCRTGTVVRSFPAINTFNTGETTMDTTRRSDLAQREPMFGGPMFGGPLGHNEVEPMNQTLQFGDTQIDGASLAEVSRRYSVKELSLFGSSVRGEMPQSA
jgi:hypothetical protein